ncbi:MULTISPECIES: hypothetical protein [Corynebacterium]|uniref:hypothetical protein n=1 Tax=Corynebacterium TaxID=1716 RepID=UPI00130E8FEF|nr:hypothetical protein [Corynebacterium aurimucosum]
MHSGASTGLGHEAAGYCTAVEIVDFHTQRLPVRVEAHRAAPIPKDAEAAHLFVDVDA